VAAFNSNYDNFAVDSMTSERSMHYKRTSHALCLSFAVTAVLLCCGWICFDFQIALFNWQYHFIEVWKSDINASQERFSPSALEKSATLCGNRSDRYTQKRILAKHMQL